MPLPLVDPEKLIMERSEHLSRDGVASYKCTTPVQQRAVCSTLTGVPATASTQLPIESDVSAPTVPL